MPAFGFPPWAEPPAGTLIPDHGSWFESYAIKYPLDHQSPEAYQRDHPTQNHQHSEQDYSSCFEQEELSETSSDDSRYAYGSYGYGGDQNDNTGKQGDKGLDSYHHEDDYKHDAYYYADVPHNYVSPGISTYSSSFAPPHIPHNGISAYSSIPYIPAYPMAAPSFHAYPNAWSDLGTTSPMDPSAGFGNPLLPSTWGVQGTTSSAQSPYASLQTPAYAYMETHSPWLRSTPGTDSSRKPVASSMELRQSQVHKASSDNHIEGSQGSSAKVLGAHFPTPAAQSDEMTKTITEASGSPVIREPAVDSSSTIKEDNIRDTENANVASSKSPNLSSECELLLVSIYNMSTLLKKKLSKYPDTEGHLDVNMLESTIGLLSCCLLKQSADNSTKLTCKVSPQSQQSIQESSSKPNVPPCPSAMLNKDTARPLSHVENEQIVGEAVVKSLLHHEHDLGLSAFCHQARGVLDAEHSLEEQQTVPSTDWTLSDAAEESFDKSDKQGDVPELYTLLNGSTDATLTTCEGEFHLETLVAFDSDAEDWEYITSPSRSCI